MSQESLDQLRRERAAQAAQDRFLRQLAESYPVVQVTRVRCPTCHSVAQGRPQHSERDGDLSVQRRKCHVCQTMFLVIVS
jgi:transposase-like protein